MALNINGEKTRAVAAESQLQTNIDNEAMRAQGVEKSLSERIGYAETTDEDGQVVPPSGVYVALKTESDRAKTEEQALKDEITNLKDKDLDLDKKIDKVKADILGDTGLLDTYDTLQKIEEWIQGPGVNSTELTEAIANEAKLRQETDDALSTSISQNRTDIDKHQASLSKIEGDATVENSIKWHVAQEATLRAKADGELSTRIDDHKTKLDTIENAITTLNSDATIIGSVSNTVSEALKEYETKQQAAQKLTDAKAYTDSSIAALDVSSPYGEDSYYVANIAQVDGKIIPQWRALPFDLTSIAARYDEETGNLTLPINTIMVAVVENGG